MGWHFHNDNEVTAMASKKERYSGELTVFQEKSFFRGVLNFSKPLSILGNFEGEIRGTSVLEIGEKAEIKATIEATHVIIYGKVTGNVLARDKIELKHGSKLIGNVKTISLEIEDGVVFEGQSEVPKDSKKTG